MFFNIVSFGVIIMILDNKGFDLWANNYDKDVEITDDNNDFPFAGYKELLNYIYNVVRSKDNAKLLDIGIGTGILATKLYELNYDIYGIDFSDKMLEASKEKMPNAKLIKWDFSLGLPREIKNEKFDFVVSTYALHHLTDEKKIQLIDSISSILKDDGLILIGDVSFTNKKDYLICKEENKDYWDSDEYYFIFDDIKRELENKYKCEYIKISHCAGVLILELN